MAAKNKVKILYKVLNLILSNALSFTWASKTVAKEHFELTMPYGLVQRKKSICCT